MSLLKSPEINSKTKPLTLLIQFQFQENLTSDQVTNDSLHFRFEAKSILLLGHHKQGRQWLASNIALPNLLCSTVLLRLRGPFACTARMEQQLSLSDYTL